MKVTNDAYGQMLLAQQSSGDELCEIIERDDKYIDTGSVPGLYFFEHKKWDSQERQVIKHAKGRILDIGCGAGRHSLYLQQKGFEVTAIDNSPGAIEVCRLRGVANALVCPIDDVVKFAPDSFDTVLMMGNNFGLFSGPEKARMLLEKLFTITSADARIIAGTRNPYKTENPYHLSYHQLNKKRRRLPGQLKIRARFGTIVGEWFDYLFVSPEEMQTILKESDWQIEKFFGPTDYNYLAVISKRDNNE